MTSLASISFISLISCGFKMSSSNVIADALDEQLSHQAEKDTIYSYSSRSKMKKRKSKLTQFNDDRFILRQCQVVHKKRDFLNCFIFSIFKNVYIFGSKLSSFSSRNTLNFAHFSFSELFVRFIYNKSEFMLCENKV